MNKKHINIIFISIFIMILIGFGFKPFFKQKNVNMVENRMAYKVETINFTKMYQKSEQNKLDNVLSDQIFLSSSMKLFNQILKGKSAILLTNILFNDCDITYRPIFSGLNFLNCTNQLIPVGGDTLKENQEVVTKNLHKINNYYTKKPVPTYVYFINRDISQNFNDSFKDQQKIYRDYFISTLNKNIKFDLFELKGSKHFDKTFLDTDHHMTAEGQYETYEDLVKLLDLSNPVKIVQNICTKNKVMSGTKGARIGGRWVIDEAVCFNEYKLNNFDIIINNEPGQYGMDTINVNTKKRLTYAMMFGGDYAEVIIKNKGKNNHKNLLVLAESYSNAINKLLANHYQNTYILDSRHYETLYGEKINVSDYVKKHNIDQVLYYGNIGLYTMLTEGF